MKTDCCKNRRRQNNPIQNPAIQDINLFARQGWVQDMNNYNAQQLHVEDFPLANVFQQQNENNQDSQQELPVGVSIQNLKHPSYWFIDDRFIIYFWYLNFMLCSKLVISYSK